MGKSMWHGVVLAALGLAAVPMALPAAAGPYGTVAVHQASGTPSPPAAGNSPFAGCDISGFYDPSSERNYLNTEVSPRVAVNPTDPRNIIGVYQQDLFQFGSGRGLVAAVSHNGGRRGRPRSRHSASAPVGTRQTAATSSGRASRR